MDKNGDIDFVKSHKATEQVRGGLPYYQPNGWMRYGLNIQKYNDKDGNDNWLRMDGNKY